MDAKLVFVGHVWVVDYNAISVVVRYVGGGMFGAGVCV